MLSCRTLQRVLALMAGEERPISLHRKDFQCAGIDLWIHGATTELRVQ